MKNGVVMKKKTLRKCEGFLGGAEGDRTLDLRLAKPALSQLSYDPRVGTIPFVFADAKTKMVGLG